MSAFDDDSDDEGEVPPLLGPSCVSTPAVAIIRHCASSSEYSSRKCVQ